MYKTILDQITEVEQLIGHNEGAGYEHELERLLEALSKMNKKAVWYAFTRRVSEDIPQGDGSVKKVSTFQFEGWV